MRSVCTTFLNNSGFPEGDLTGLFVHAVDDGQGLQVNSLRPEDLAAGLEAFLNDDAGSHKLRAGLLYDLDQSFQRLPVGQKSSMSKTRSPSLINSLETIMS